MSQRMLRLAGLAFIALILMVLGGASTPAAHANDCIDVIMYAINPATGICQQVSPCAIPQGWIVVPQCSEES